MSKKILCLLLLGSLVLGYFSKPWVDQYLSGQTAKKKMPELRGIYQASAQYENAIRNPVIVIPGMMGSKLQETATGRTIWGAFNNDSIDPDIASDVRLLACPLGEEMLEPFDDGVGVNGVLDTLKIKIAGLSLDRKAYFNILKMLGVGGYRDEELGLAGAIDYGDRHFTCFQFPYDWRLDNAQNAQRLHEFLLKKRAYVEAQRKNKFGSSEPVKFDIVAHSMGGLVARYYLRYGDQGHGGNGNLELNWAGAKNVDRLILIGTPSNGSTKSLVTSHNGFEFSTFLDSFPSGMVGTLPSIYQLLPSGPNACIFDSETDEPLDHYDVETWDKRGWGILNPDQDSVLQQLMPDVATVEERRANAKVHLTHCLGRARLFHQLLNVPSAPPAGTTIHLFAGDAIPTVETVSSNLVERTMEVRTESPGDGTVTRRSALADQRTEQSWTPALQTPIQFSDVRFLFEDHFGLTRAAEFTDNALYLLLEDPTKSSPIQPIEPTPINERVSE